MSDRERNGRAKKGQVWRGADGNGAARHGKVFITHSKGRKHMARYTVEITGVTPLLMNKPEEYGFDEKWVEKKASTDWEKQAYRKLYCDKDGNPYQPSTHIEQALIDAGKKLQIKGQRKATYSKLFGSMITVEPEAIPHLVTKFEIHKALVVMPATKGRVVRFRPKFNDWKLRFSIISEDEIPGAVIKEALEIAGKFSGIGDWRPQKKGKFGKFQVTHFEKE